MLFEQFSREEAATAQVLVLYANFNLTIYFFNLNNLTKFKVNQNLYVSKC